MSIATPEEMTSGQYLGNDQRVGRSIIYLETEAPVVSKDDYVKGNIIVDANSKYDQPVTSMPMVMRGRSNSTWTMPKRPIVSISTQKLLSTGTW